MPIGDRIRTTRLERGWTQEELARRLGVRQNVISRLESGTVKSPGIPLIRRLARVLGVSADYLVGMYDDTEDAACALAAASP